MCDYHHIELFVNLNYNRFVKKVFFLFLLLIALPVWRDVGAACNAEILRHCDGDMDADTCLIEHEDQLSHKCWDTVFSKARQTRGDDWYHERAARRQNLKNPSGLFHHPSTGF